MDEKEKLAETVGNICTILGGALLLFPLIDQATKTLIPEMQKLQSGEISEELKSLPPAKEKQDEPKEDSERDKEREKERNDQQEKERKSHADEIAELKRKLAEFESKPDKKENKPDKQNNEG